MKDKTIERTIKIPRVRIKDCCRLIFRLSEEPVWRDMDLDPDLFPIYQLPLLRRNVYTFSGGKITITPGESINDLVREICQICGGEDPGYLHTIIFRVSGDIEIQTEVI